MALRETYEPTLVRDAGETSLAIAAAWLRRRSEALRLLAGGPPTPTGLEGGVVGLPPGPRAPTGQDGAWEGTPAVIAALRDGIDDR